MSSNEPSDVPDSSATVLYVGNLDRRVTDVMMLDILRKGLPHIGDKVLSAKMFASSDPTQGPDGYCFVQFHDNNAACQAMTFLIGRDFCGKKVKVNWATSSNNSTNGGPANYKIIGSSVTIFVGDLDDNITDSELRQAFDPFGEILNAKVVCDAVTQKSKNYGFISFSNKPDAEKAIRDMHGAMLRTRPIKTNWATRNQKTQQALDYDQVHSEAKEENCTVYVTNLPDRVTDDIVARHFGSFGKIIGKPKLFEGKNFCFIKFDSHDTATKAIVEGNGSELNGAVLKCWWGKENAADNVNGPSSNYSTNYSNSGYRNNQVNANSQQQQQQQQQQQALYQQYMQYYSNPAYQQQYYQYWMQCQQMMQSQQQGATTQQGNAQQQQYPYYQQAYNQLAYTQQQQQGGYPPNSYQN